MPGDRFGLIANFPAPVIHPPTLTPVFKIGMKTLIKELKAFAGMLLSYVLQSAAEKMVGINRMEL